MARIYKNFKLRRKNATTFNFIKRTRFAHRGGGNKGLSYANSTNTHKSHKLPKIALSLSLIFCSANIAFAEESGGFVGFGIGGGGTQFEHKTINVDGTKVSDKEKLDGINYGFVAGYKQFFTPYLGLRYYANVDLHHNLKKFTGTNDEGVNESYRPDIILINYGANVDFLGNFVVTESVDFGGFVGVGIGANSITGKYIKEYKDIADAGGVKFNDTGFDAWLNVGLRTNIATNHGLEVVARVPFIPVKMWDYSYDDGVGTEKYKLTFGQTFSILARYTFSF